MPRTRVCVNQLVVPEFTPEYIIMVHERFVAATGFFPAIVGVKRSYTREQRTTVTVCVSLLG